MKKILIISAKYGSGHHSVATNIYEALKGEESTKVEHLDLQPYANFLGRLSFRFFDFVIKKRPELLFDAGYELIDNKIVSRQQTKVVKLFFDNKDLREKIKKINPDIVLATHYYGATISLLYKNRKLISPKIVTILTDYRSHSEWLSHHDEKEAFIVASDIMKNELIEYGVLPEKIFSFGIPIERGKLHFLRSKGETYKKYGLFKDRKTIVFFGGSQAGNLIYLTYFKYLVKTNFNANVIFISGRNDKLRKKANEYLKKTNYNKNIKVLGFTNDVYNILNIADLVITKPGGATITECLEFRVPLLLIPGFGGQEKHNTRFIKKMNYGVFARSKFGFVRYLKLYMNNKVFYKTKKKAIEKRKVQDSMKLLLDYLSKI